MFMLPPFALFREIAEPTPFLYIFLSLEICSFWGTVTTMIPSGAQKVLLTLVTRNYSIGSSPLFNDSDIPTFLHRSSPDISFAPSSLAPGRCFRTWALITYQFYKPSFFLRSFASTNVLFLQFSESSLA